MPLLQILGHFYLPTSAIVLNLGTLFLSITKTVEVWDEVSTKLRACGAVMIVSEAVCLPCHGYALMPGIMLRYPSNPFLKRLYNSRVHSVVDLVAFALQASVVATVSWIKDNHDSTSEPVEDMGWAVLALGIANLIVALVAVLIANGAAWFGWIKKLVRTLKRDCSEWMSQRRSPNNTSNHSTV